MCNNRSNIIKFSDFEEDSKNKVSNKCRSKLRIALAVIDILLLIAFILTICFDVATFIPTIKTYRVDFFRVVLNRKINISNTKKICSVS